MNIFSTVFKPFNRNKVIQFSLTEEEQNPIENNEIEVYKCLTNFLFEMSMLPNFENDYPFDGDQRKVIKKELDKVLMGSESPHFIVNVQLKKKGRFFTKFRSYEEIYNDLKNIFPENATHACGKCQRVTTVHELDGHDYVCDNCGWYLYGNETTFLKIIHALIFDTSGSIFRKELVKKYGISHIEFIEEHNRKSRLHVGQ